jgi:tyrosyl-tRNA synthetase
LPLNLALGPDAPREQDKMSDDFSPKSDFLATLVARGYVHQCSDFAGLDDRAKTGDLTAYIGFDCTAPSLHVGSLVQIMLLRWLQRTGGKPIALMGGGTTRVGDPSGKDESRKILTLEQIEDNKNGIKRVFSKFLTFGDGAKDAIMPDNAEWLAGLNYIDFLRDIGRHFSVNRMLAMDSVKARLEREHELSFLEFNYMCLQAYDFVELYRRHGCVLQMGGSDQWGNIVTGLDLGRRLGTAQLYALTSPLLTTASGAKMGKTAQGAVWLDESLLPVFDYWQYWRNCEDRDIGRFLKLFTELPLDEIARLEALGGAEINEAKKVLASEATAMVHGREAALAAAEAARQTFEEGAIAESLPAVEIDAAEVEAGLGVLAAFVKAGLVASTSEARRQIKGGGLKVNDDAITDERAILTAGDAANGMIKLSLGRKRHILLKLV